MKKLLALVLAVIILLSFAGCGETSGPNVNNELKAEDSHIETPEELRSRVYNYQDPVSDIRRDVVSQLIKMAKGEEADYTSEEIAEMLEYYYSTITDICEVFENEDWADAPDVIKAKHIREDLEELYSNVQSGALSEENVADYLDFLKDFDRELEYFWFAIREYWDKLS